MDTKKLRQKILDLAIHGKLVPQDPNDEPASVLLERIKAEKERLIKEGKIKRSKKSAKTSDTPHYENVPFEVPDNWVWTTLGEILELVSGQDFPPEKYNANIAGIPYIIGASNIENEQLIINRWTESPSVYSYLNDLLVVCKGAGVGKMAINKIGVAHIARQIQAVRGYTNYTDIKYIKAVVKNNIENIISKANGLIPGLKRELLLSLQLPLPPISEQHRIVYEIERWFSLIDQIEQGKADLQSIIKQAKSKILDLAIHGKLVPQNPNDEPAIELLKRINPDFTPCDNGHYENLPGSWCLTDIKSIFTINPKNKVADDVIAGFVPMTNIADGYSNEFRFEPRLWGHIKKGFTHFAEGDIVVAKISPCLENRKSAIVTSLPNGIGAGTTELFVLRSQCVLPEYGLYFFKSDSFINHCAGSFNGVVGQQRVSKSIIESIKFPLPPLSEQKRIVDAVHTAFTKLDTMMESL